MIAAIYARKSTDQNVADEEKSVTRQIERATAYAETKGWTVATGHVYADDGISGAEFVKRPGFLRLLNALEPRPPFQVLIMSEESRLGRESIETGWTLKKITDAGVRVFYYLEDRERTLGSSMDKVMMHLSTFAAEMEREKAVQRTRDAMRRKAERGHVAGGRVYGYDNQRVGDHIERVINPVQADVVRRIFREIAEGRGFTRVAKGFTAEGIPSPHPGRGWAATAVRRSGRSWRRRRSGSSTKPCGGRRMGAWTGRVRSTYAARTASCGGGRRPVSMPSICSPGSWCAGSAAGPCTPPNARVSAGPLSSTTCAVPTGSEGISSAPTRSRRR
jgi:DNA invertase Pin-like site-specific DNA recombinase